MKNYSYILFFAVLIGATSCSRKIQVQEAYFLENETAKLNTDRVDIKTYYVGDDGYNISFQIDIDNRSESPVHLSERDIELELNYTGSRKNVMAPIRKADLIIALDQEERRLEGEKNADTAANIILSGVGILGGILTGAPAVETIVYGSGTAADIVSRRSEYGAAQGSIEEQIQYYEKYTLEEATIEAGDSATFDIHFERVMANCRSELVIFYGDNSYVAAYDLVVEERKIRR